MFQTYTYPTVAFDNPAWEDHPPHVGDWPQGMTPNPPAISVPEGETGRIEFTCWEGM